jgi:hypothetical protein
MLQTLATYDTPILIIGYNRPDKLKVLIDAIRIHSPSRICVALDGPKKNSTQDLANVEKSRAAIDLIDWKCDLQTLIQIENLGCKIGVTTAINWFFSKYEFGIILEDDCRPTPEFFEFTARRLIEHKDDSRIMHISGSSYFIRQPKKETSYYYSRLPNVWGWATWKRAWNTMQLIDSNLDVTITRVKINDYFNDKKISKWFLRYVEEAMGPKSSVWSTSWTLSIINNQGVCISPMGNLVENIGFRDSATHSTSASFRKYEQFTFGEGSNLPSPKTLEVNEELDRLRFKTIEKTDPNEFLSRKMKILFLKSAYKILPKFVKQKGKLLLSKHSTLSDFFMK